MNRLVFRTCTGAGQYRDDLERLFQSEWADFSFAESDKPEANLPPTILALRNNEVIGGLAYSRYKEPHGESEVVWLNAVYVSPDWRGQGVASELINRGVNQVSATTQGHLYAYTNLPSMYEHLGWSVVDIESEEHHKVMKISLES